MIAKAAMLALGLSLLGGAGVKAFTQQSVGEQPAQLAAPVITDGPTLFRERGCAHCHTIRGVGGSKGPDLSGVGRRLKKGAIQEQIVKGGEAMPEFGDVLPAEEIAALTKYLHKCRDKKPRESEKTSPVEVAPAG